MKTIQRYFLCTSRCDILSTFWKSLHSWKFKLFHFTDC